MLPGSPLMRSHCWQSLLDDFVGSNIDAAAALVENAGRYLYLLSEAHTRMANMLEVCACPV